MEGVPGAADERGGAVAIVAQQELPAPGREVAEQLGVGRAFDDVEGQFAPGLDAGDGFLENRVAR